MNLLKAELLKYGKRVGDGGSTKDQEISISTFLSVLQRYLTPEAIQTFPVVCIRSLYVGWVLECQTGEGREAADSKLPLYLEVAPEPRQAPERIVLDKNVVSFFPRKA